MKTANCNLYGQNCVFDNFKKCRESICTKSVGADFSKKSRVKTESSDNWFGLASPGSAPGSYLRRTPHRCVQRHAHCANPDWSPRFDSNHVARFCSDVFAPKHSVSTKTGGGGVFLRFEFRQNICVSLLFEDFDNSEQKAIGIFHTSLLVSCTMGSFCRSKGVRSPNFHNHGIFPYIFQFRQIARTFQRNRSQNGTISQKLRKNLILT